MLAHTIQHGSQPCRAGVYLFFIFFGLATLGVLLSVQIYIVVHTFRHAMRVHAIRIEGSGRVPELSLKNSNQYHLFLSRAPRPAAIGIHRLRRIELR
jgi:hypothetical protein